MKAFKLGVENSLKKSNVKKDVEEMRNEEIKEQEIINGYQTYLLRGRASATDIF